jgi:hypothetical protein
MNILYFCATLSALVMLGQFLDDEPFFKSLVFVLVFSLAGKIVEILT